MAFTRSASVGLATPRGGDRPSSPPPATTKSPTKTRAPPRAAAAAPPAWTHAPSRLTLAWLWFSIPIVFWDMGYVLLRPHSMPGGSLHWPLWVPYAIQCDLDLTYGWKEWEAGAGWNTAQTAVNGVENLAYIAYLGIWYANAKVDAQGVRTALTGRAAAAAVTLAFGTFVVTFFKTVLYWLNEAFSGFANIGHNEFGHLFIFWIIPNGAWLVFPAFFAYKFGDEIITALTQASSGKTREKKNE